MTDSVRKTILLVEDETIIAMSEAKLLERCGYRVITAVNGIKAIAAVRDNPAIDLILMDINLGRGMDGTETAAAILKERNVPVVFLSSHTEPEVVELTEKITSYGYVVKNSGITVLDASIKMAFRLFEARRKNDLQREELETANEEMTAAMEELEATNEELILSQQEIMEREQILRIQHDLSMSLNTMSDFNEALTRVLEAMTRFKGIDSGGVYVADRADGSLRLVSHRGLTPRFVERVSYYAPDSPHCVLARAGQARYGHYKDIRPVADEEKLREGLLALAFIPVLHGGELLAAMNLASHSVDDISPSSRVALETTALQIGSALLRLRSEESRRESERRLATLLDNIPGFAYRCANDRDWTMEYISEGCRDITGYGPDDFISNRTVAFNDIVHPDFREPLWNKWQEMLATGSYFEEEYPVIAADGGERWVWERGRGVYADDGRLLCLEGFITDITGRKQAEEMLARSMERYQLVAESTGDIIWQLDRKGRVIYASPAVERIFGYTVEEARARTFADFFPEEELGMATSAFMMALAGESYQLLHFTGRKKDGAAVPIEASVTPIREAGEIVGIQGIARDISARLAMEERLHRKEDEYRLMVENINDVIFTQDMEGRLTYVSPVVERLSGYRVQELLGKSFAAFIHPDDLPGLMVSYGKTLQGEIEPYEFRLFHKDGTPAYVRSSSRLVIEEGVPRGLIGVVTDISARKNAEAGMIQALEALRAKESELELLLKGMINAFVLFESVFDETGRFVSYRFLFINEAYERITGVKNEEVRGKTVHQVWPGTEESWVEAYGDVAITGVPRSFEMFHEPTGKLYRCNVYRPGEENDRFCVIFDDVTARKAMEDELRRNESRLRGLVEILQHRTESVQEFLDFALEKALELTGSALGYIYFYDSDNEEFILNTWSKEVMQECHVTDPQTRYRLEKTGLWGEAVRQDRPIVVNDFHEPHPYKKGYPEGHAELRKFMTIPVKYDGSIVAVVGVANKKADYGETDVLQLLLLMDSVWKRVEQMRAIEALRESEEKHRVLLDEATDPIFSFSAEGRYLYANRAFAEGVGKPAAAITGGTMWDVFDKEEADKRFAALQQVFATGEEKVIEVRVPREEGDRYYITTITPIKDGAGSVSLVICSSKNITERKQVELDLASALREKESLLRELQHRIKNSLVMITSLIDLEADRQEDAASMTLLKDLGSRVNSLAGLYTILYQSGSVSNVKLDEYLERIIQYLTGVYLVDNKAVSISYRLDPVAADAKDAASLGLIVNELLTNALKYAFPGERAGEIGVVIEKREDGLLLLVRDNGVGLPEGFDSGKGRGLGLELVKMLSRQMGGAMESRSGSEGTSFMVTLKL